MRSAVAVLAALLAVAAWGCLDFVEPGAGPPQLLVNVTIRDADPPLARLRASLRPTDPEAGPVAVTPGPIRILGRAVPPRRTSGLIRWDAEWTPDPAELLGAEVVVDPPALPGRPDSVLSLPLVWRAGPASVAIGDDGLLLPVRVPPAGPDSILVSWNLGVQAATEDAFPDVAVLVSGRGLPPDTLRVSRSLLPAGSTPLAARLSVSASTAPEEHDGSTARLFLATEMIWDVTR